LQNGILNTKPQSRKGKAFESSRLGDFALKKQRGRKPQLVTALSIAGTYRSLRANPTWELFMNSQSI
jgi:hypothetical protein